jgi:hypothetical protein
MKTRRNRKFRGGNPKKSCKKNKIDWERNWKQKLGYEKYHPRMLYPGPNTENLPLMNGLESDVEGVPRTCFEASNKDCHENKRDWELFWSKQSEHTIYNPTTLYEGNEVNLPKPKGLTDDLGNPKTCDKAPLYLQSDPQIDKSSGYKVIDMSVSDALVHFSTKIAEAYTTRPKPLKCDHWSLKEVDTEEHFHFFGMIKNNRYVVVNPDIYLNAFLAAAEVLERNGYTVDRMDPGKVNIVYTNTTKSLAVSSGFAVHCDNDGYRTKRISSVVVYVQADCEGGELEIYDHIPLFGKPVLEDIISPQTTDESTRRVVLLDGNKYHYPKPVKKGTRIAVVYNIKQKY